MSDLYEAGDINTVEGSTDVDDIDDIDDVDEDDENETDENEAGTDDFNEVERGGGGGGTPLAVLDYLARSLSDDPDSVAIDSDERGHSVRLSLHVAPDDMGRVIGRRGRTAQAIRTLVNVAGAKDGIQTSVDIVDD